MAKYSDLVFRYMRIDHLPQIWCPGCGNGILMRDVVVAIDNLKLEREKVVLIALLSDQVKISHHLLLIFLHILKLPLHSQGVVMALYRVVRLPWMHRFLVILLGQLI